MKLFGRLPPQPAESDVAGTVQGERGLPSVRQALSLQSKVSNVLAMGLMLAMGAAVLTAYYLHTAQRQAQAHQKAQAASSNRAQAEMALPALGAIVPPAGAAARSAGPIALAAMTPQVLPDLSQPSSASVLLPPSASQNYVSAPRPSSLERRLSGAAFARAALAPDGGAASSGARADTAAAPTAVNASAAVAGPPAATAGIATLLHSESSSTTPARVLPTQRLLLPKGAFIDCTLETAIDSTLPGMTTCVTATDTFGVDGKVLLLERGTKLVGETRGQVQQGAARVFVLWTEARTPTGVIVPLDSPAADELGRAGLPGTVDRHFWERFGAALFISTIDGAVQTAVQSSNRGSGTIIYNPSATQDVTTEVLKSTLSIAPTVRKNNGDRIQILVARDIDFTGVYELRRAGSQQ
jgi:type IV secretion system protein VirB10